MRLTTREIKSETLVYIAMVNKRKQAAIDRAQSRLLRSRQIAATIDKYRKHLTPETYDSLKYRFAPRSVLGKVVAPKFNMNTQIEEALHTADSARRRAKGRYISQRLLAAANRDITRVRSERSRRPLGADTMDEDVRGVGELMRGRAALPESTLANRLNRHSLALQCQRQFTALDRELAGKVANVQFSGLVRKYDKTTDKHVYFTALGRGHRFAVDRLGIRENTWYRMPNEMETEVDTWTFTDGKGKSAFGSNDGVIFRYLLEVFQLHEYEDSQVDFIRVDSIADSSPDRPVMDPLDLPNNLSGTYIANPYLTYKAAHDAALPDRFKVETVYENSCGVDILMRWKEHIEGPNIEKCRHKRLCIDGKFTLRALFEKVLGKTLINYDDMKNIALTMNDMITFCRKFHMVLRAFDAKGNLVLSYSPSMDGCSPNNNMPSSMYLVWAYGHFELMSKEQVNSLSKRSGMHDADTTEYRVYADLKVSQNYHIRDYEKDSQESTVLCRTITELAELFRSLERECDATGVEKRVVVHCAVNIDFVYFFFSNMNQYLTAQFTPNMSVKQLVYRYNKITVVIYNVANGQGTVGAPQLEPPSQTYYDQFLAWNNRLQAALVNRQNLSHYSQDLVALFDECGRAALNGTLRDAGKYGPEGLRRSAESGALHPRRSSAAEFAAIDICKCYTSALMKQTHLPIFSVFDDYYAYDGHAIEDYTLYTVSLKREAKGIWLIKYNLRYNLCYGRNIRGDHAAGIIDVHGYVRPYKKRENHVVKVIEDLYRSELETKDKKFIVNAAIGCTGKRQNKKHETGAFNTYDEAVAYLGGEQHGKIFRRDSSFLADINLDAESAEVLGLIGQSLDTEDLRAPDDCEEWPLQSYRLRSKRELFLAQRSTKATLRNGFYPIQHLVYDQARHDMFELALKCVQAGARVCAIRTDCLYISNCANPQALTTYQEPEWVDVGGAMRQRQTPDELLASIGTVRCDGEGLEANKLPRTRIERLCNQALDFADDDCNEFRTEREREWRRSDAWQQDVFAFMQQHDKVFVKGITAGSGKTTIILKYIAHLGKMDETLFVFPDNATILEMKQKCAREFGCTPQMKTAHKLLGIAFDEQLRELERGEASTEGIQFVVLDEMYKYDMGILLRIRNFMRRNPQLKFIGAGDIFQLEPINDHFDNVGNRQLYRQRCIAKLFDKNEVYLQCSKRFESVDDERAIADIKRDLFEQRLSVAEVVRKYGIPERRFDADAFDHATTCITLSNYTRRKVAVVINRKATAGKECIEVADREGYILRYHVGMKIVSKERIKMGAAIIQKNYLLEVRAIADGNVVLHEPLEGTEYTIPQDKLRFFAIENSRTGYSIQGATLEGSTGIFDLHSDHMTPEWFYTAITRNRRLRDNVVYHMHSAGSKGTVYRIDCKVDGKFYVGSTVRSVEERVKEHFASARQGSQLRLHRHIREHGEQAFEVSVLLTTTELDTLRELEGKRIAELLPELNSRGEGLSSF